MAKTRRPLEKKMPPTKMAKQATLVASMLRKPPKMAKNVLQFTNQKIHL